MKLTVGATGPADPDDVWDRYVRPARWSEWSPQIRSVDYRGLDDHSVENQDVETHGVGNRGVDGHCVDDHGVDDHGDRLVLGHRGVDRPDSEIAPGGRGTVHGPCGVGVEFEILAVDVEKRCWTWQVTITGITLRLAHHVVGHALGTQTMLDIAGPAPIVIGYAPIARVALGRLVRRQ